MSAEVKLSKSQIAFVDDEDFDRVSKYTWYANKMASGSFRAASNRKICPYNYMHQLIMDSKGVDHIDGNPLNNTKANLRICTQNQNSKNQKKPKNNTSGYKGVTYDSRPGRLAKRWIAQIKVEGKRKNLGYFSDLVDAARAYDEAAKFYFGEFANLNFKA